MWKQERKHPTPMRRRLSRTHAVFWRVISERWVPVSGNKSTEPRSVVEPLHASSVIRPERRTYVVLSDRLMIRRVAGTIGCLDLRIRAFALGGQVSTQWSRCPLDSMVRYARDNVAPLRRSSAGLMSARTRKLTDGVERRHPGTICKASLMAMSMRRVRPLRQYRRA